MGKAIDKNRKGKGSRPQRQGRSLKEREMPEQQKSDTSQSNSNTENALHQPQEESPLDILWRFFVGRPDTYFEKRRSWERIFKDKEKKDSDQLTKDIIAEHLAGRRCIGTYPISVSLNNVPWLCYDFDSHDKPEDKPQLIPHVLALCEWFRPKGFCTLIEDTGGDGFHLWVLFLCQVPAKKAVALANLALEEVSIPFEVEIFPKQSKADIDHPGNGLRLPWGRHEKGGWSHFLSDDVSPDDKNAITAIQTGRRMTEMEIDKLLPSKAFVSQKTKELAPRRWSDVIPEGQRHNSMVEMAGELRARRFPPERILTELNTHNQARCSPPLSDGEIHQIWESIMKATGVDDINAVGERESQADILVKSALEAANLFHTPENKAYAVFANGAKHEIWPLRAPNFKQWLSFQAYQSFGKVPYAEALNTALYTLEGIALWDREEKPLSVRVAWQDGTLWYDLGDWTAVKITEGGWEVEPMPPILFRHYQHQAPQVLPKKPGDLGCFLQIVGIDDAAMGALILTYLIASLVPNIPQPFLLICGDQGGGKTVLSRLIRSLVDPSHVGLLTAPDSVRDFAQLCQHHRAVYLDNIRSLPGWLIEGFSKLSTGSAFVKRALYTDDDDVFFVNQGLGGLNGISPDIDAPDLLDRALFIRLSRIPDDKRKKEKEVLHDFEEARPFILAGMFDAFCKALKIKDQIRPLGLPRMADYYVWACAAAKALDIAEGDFQGAFLANIQQQSQEALEVSIIAPVVQEFMADQGWWQGTPTELLAKFNNIASDSVQRLREWPKSPVWLSRRLRAIVPNLAQLDIKIEEGVEGGKRIITFFRQTGENTVIPSLPSLPEAGLGSGNGMTVKEEFTDRQQQLPSPDDSNDSKKRYGENLPSGLTPKLDDGKDSKIPSFSKEQSGENERVDVFLPDGTPIRYCDLIAVWKADGGHIISDSPDTVVFDLEKEIEDLDVDRLIRVADILYQKPADPCHACGSTNWCQRPDGGWFCGRCHPKEE